jgi:hypothetical protein
MNTQMTGSHKNGEVRTFRSRSSEKSQAIPTANRKVAIKDCVISSARERN